MFDGVTYDCGAIYDMLSKLAVVSPSANVAAVVTGAQIAVVNSSAKSAAVEIAAKAAENSVPVVIENAAMAADKAGYSAAIGEQGAQTAETGNSDGNRTTAATSGGLKAAAATSGHQQQLQAANSESLARKSWAGIVKGNKQPDDDVLDLEIDNRELDEDQNF